MRKIIYVICFALSVARLSAQGVNTYCRDTLIGPDTLQLVGVMCNATASSVKWTSSVATDTIVNGTSLVATAKKLALGLHIFKIQVVTTTGAVVSAFDTALVAQIDTNKPCPPIIICPTCPPPIVCPVCPPPIKQRTAVAYYFDAILNKTTFYYDDGTKSP